MKLWTSNRDFKGDVPYGKFQFYINTSTMLKKDFLFEFLLSVLFFSKRDLEPADNLEGKLYGRAKTYSTGWSHKKSISWHKILKNSFCWEYSSGNQLFWTSAIMQKCKKKLSKKNSQSGLTNIAINAYRWWSPVICAYFLGLRFCNSLLR